MSRSVSRVTCSPFEERTHSNWDSAKAGANSLSDLQLNRLMISPARKVGFTVLRKTEEGGFASDLLLSTGSPGFKGCRTGVGNCIRLLTASGATGLAHKARDQP